MSGAKIGLLVVVVVAVVVDVAAVEVVSLASGCDADSVTFCDNAVLRDVIQTTNTISRALFCIRTMTGY